MGIHRYKHVAEDFGDRYSLYKSVLRKDKAGSVVKYADHVAETAALREALELIRDGDSECSCDCLDENCCVKAKAFCPHCIAQTALGVRNDLEANS